ncbi:unnamed protein product [Prorocentrum cordatum]|uniref:Uncharacterized protein n=1 Tax=Prorocentrum cordatum TaxID=2364126 RepID=A0ABN9TYU6_9DINO|nr:unnamed protein product [Polarella glacialis]
MGPAGSDAAEARAPRPLAVDGGGAQHKTNSRGPRRGLGAQVPRRRGGEAGRGPLVLTHDVGGLGNGREALRRSRPPRRRARAPAATSAARPGRGTRPLRRGRGGGARGGARQRRPCAELCGGGRAALGWSLR